MKQQIAHPKTEDLKNQTSSNTLESLTHEQLFVTHYQKLLGWAEYLCHYNKIVAEDLVQNAYIQFVTKKPELASIDNIFGYLCRLVSNMYKNQIVRASAQKRGGNLQSVDLPMIEELIAFDSKSSEQAREMLIEIAHFAVGNRVNSKTSDVLILRFLLGYYPKEIAQIFMASIFAINNLIMRGRQELREFLKTKNNK
jgi:RNA polymerase sigma factor (sigma-70 family)